jgi:hypothetical protein
MRLKQYSSSNNISVTELKKLYPNPYDLCDNDNDTENYTRRLQTIGELYNWRLRHGADKVDWVDIGV